jgi:hypothetical protein
MDEANKIGMDIVSDDDAIALHFFESSFVWFTAME